MPASRTRSGIAAAPQEPRHAHAGLVGDWSSAAPRRVAGVGPHSPSSRAASHRRQGACARAGRRCGVRGARAALVVLHGRLGSGPARSARGRGRAGERRRDLADEPGPAERCPADHHGRRARSARGSAARRRTARRRRWRSPESRPPRRRARSRPSRRGPCRTGGGCGHGPSRPGRRAPRRGGRVQAR